MPEEKKFDWEDLYRLIKNECVSNGATVEDAHFIWLLGVGAFCALKSYGVQIKHSDPKEEKSEDTGKQVIAVE